MQDLNFTHLFYHTKKLLKKLLFKKFGFFHQLQKIIMMVLVNCSKEGNGKKVSIKFSIAKTYISPNIKKPVLLGSSLKGSISTAYQEYLFKKFNS